LAVLVDGVVESLAATTLENNEKFRPRERAENGLLRKVGGGSMTRATVSADGETITVHIPLTFRKRGGRKLVVTPDGAA
jgi:hypothetical protein